MIKRSRRILLSLVLVTTSGLIQPGLQATSCTVNGPDFTSHSTGAFLLFPLAAACFGGVVGGLVSLPIDLLRRFSWRWAHSQESAGTNQDNKTRYPKNPPLGTMKTWALRGGALVGSIQILGMLFAGWEAPR